MLPVEERDSIGSFSMDTDPIDVKLGGWTTLVVWCVCVTSVGAVECCCSTCDVVLCSLAMWLVRVMAMVGSIGRVVPEGSLGRSAMGDGV